MTGLCGRCLLEFIDWRYSQSCWYFRPSFVNCYHSYLLSGSTLPPPHSPFPVWISITYTVCKEGGGYGVLGLRRWRHFALPFMSLIFLRFTVKVWKMIITCCLNGPELQISVQGERFPYTFSILNQKKNIFFTFNIYKQGIDFWCKNFCLADGISWSFSVVPPLRSCAEQTRVWAHGSACSAAPASAANRV